MELRARVTGELSLLGSTDKKDAPSSHCRLTASTTGSHSGFAGTE